MIKHMALLALALASLVACGEKPQTLAPARTDTPAFSGSGSASGGSTAFTAPGWKPGDKTGWEQHLRARQQGSQNDYSRMN